MPQSKSLAVVVVAVVAAVDEQDRGCVRPHGLERVDELRPEELARGAAPLVEEDEERRVFASAGDYPVPALAEDERFADRGRILSAPIPGVRDRTDGDKDSRREEPLHRSRPLTRQLYLGAGSSEAPMKQPHSALSNRLRSSSSASSPPVSWTSSLHSMLTNP